MIRDVREYDQRSCCRLGQTIRRIAPSSPVVPSSGTVASIDHHVTRDSRPLVAPTSWVAPMTGISPGRHRRGNRPRLIELACLITGLVSLPLGVFWFIDARPGVGLVLFPLTPTQGVHAFDLVLVAVAFPIGIGLGTQCTRWFKRHRLARRAASVSNQFPTAGRGH